MRKVTYSQNLKDHLALLRKASEELTKEDPVKSIEQFLAEIDFVKNLLEETEKITTH